MHKLKLKNRLNLKKLFIAYLDKVHLLKKLEIETVEYEKTLGKDPSKTGGADRVPPFRFVVPLDLLRMESENCGELSHLFISEPESAVEMARDAIFTSIREVTRLKKSTTKFTVEVAIHLTVVPSVLFYHTAVPPKGLDCLRGILTAKSTPMKYVRSSVYVCRTEGCVAANDERKERKMRPLCKEICKDCFNTLHEDVRSREVGEEIVCEWVAGIGTSPNLGKCSTFAGKIKDELGFGMDITLGREYSLIGKRERNGSFDAWYISSSFCGTAKSDIGAISLPPFISELYLSVKNSNSQISPWAFVVAVSSCLGQTFVPNTAFLHLKMGLMLSLATQSGNDVPVSILAVGADTSVAGKLFRSGGNLAERCIFYSSNFSHIGGTRRQSQQGAAREEAGALVLGTDGICNLGDWSKLKKHQTDYVCKTLETGEIAFSNSDAELNTLTYSMPLRCSVWSYFNCSSVTGKTDAQTRLKALADVFGMPFLTDERNEFEMKKVCDKHLGKGSQKEENFYQIPEVELKEYVALAKKKHRLPLREDASELVKNYFVASRKDRPGCLPVGAIKTITALSEGHAKLALRTEVLYEDVVAVIYWYQQAATLLFGPSGFDFRPTDAKDENKPFYVLMDETLRRFASWLSYYLDIFTSNHSN